MKSTRILLRVCLYVLLGTMSALSAEEPSKPPRPASAPLNPLAPAEKDALVAWTVAQPAVKAAAAGHRTRVLRAWSDVVTTATGSERRSIVLVRDYDTGTAREIAINLATGAIQMRELIGIQPSREEMAAAMAIVRSDPALASFVANPDLVLIGGFHNLSVHPGDPCSREICVDFAFMKRKYEGPARYVIVNLTRGIVSHHDFRAKRGGLPPRMTEGTAP
jgi:hypothetical protein